MSLKSSDIKINVKVFAESGQHRDVVKEAKQALKELAIKYNCQLEVSGEQRIGRNFKNNFKSNIKKESGKNGVFLSFGGEIEM